MARPKKDEATRRSAPVMVKLTTAEHRRLSAEVVQLRAPSLAALLRERALTGTVTIAETVELAGPDRIALNRLGVNLNQIARVLNEQGAPALADVEGELRVILSRLNAMLDDGDGPETH